MKINVTSSKEVDVKTLSICAKCSDRCSAQLWDAEGDVIFGQEEGYVPEFMPGHHWGDYIVINIDLETGMIMNWTKPTPAQIEEFISK